VAAPSRKKSGAAAVRQPQPQPLAQPWPPPCSSPLPPPPRPHAVHATLALVRKTRRASGSAWEAAAKKLVVHHPGAPRPPTAWVAAERAAGIVGPRAAVSGLLGEEEVAVAPVRVGGGGGPPLCHLAPRPTGFRFKDPAVSSYLNALFRSLPVARRDASLPPVELSRWDLFHAHLFWAPAAANAAKQLRSQQRCPGHFGLLFHCYEYPAASPGFEHDLGWCQAGSPLHYDPAAADMRNIVMVGGSVASLGCAPGGALGQGLVWPELREVRTLVEDDLGVWAGVDVTFLEEGRARDSVLAFWVGGGEGKAM